MYGGCRGKTELHRLSDTCGMLLNRLAWERGLGRVGQPRVHTGGLTKSHGKRRHKYIPTAYVPKATITTVFFACYF